MQKIVYVSEVKAKKYMSVFTATNAMYHIKGPAH